MMLAWQDHWAYRLQSIKIDLPFVEPLVYMDHNNSTVVVSNIEVAWMSHRMIEAFINQTIGLLDRPQCRVWQVVIYNFVFTWSKRSDCIGAAAAAETASYLTQLSVLLDSSPFKVCISSLTAALHVKLWSDSQNAPTCGRTGSMPKICICQHNSWATKMSMDMAW